MVTELNEMIKELIKKATELKIRNTEIEFSYKHGEGYEIKSNSNKPEVKELKQYLMKLKNELQG